MQSIEQETIQNDRSFEFCWLKPSMWFTKRWWQVGQAEPVRSCVQSGNSHSYGAIQG